MDQQADQAGGAQQGAGSRVEAMLEHQAADAAERLRRCPVLLLAFAASTHSEDCLHRALPDSAEVMISALRGLDPAFPEFNPESPGFAPESLQNVMQVFCAAFGEVRERESDPQARMQMAEATVAIYLLCVCRMIQVTSGAPVSGIPSLETDDAAHLFASLIATVMAGGKLVLESDQARRTLVPQGCYAVQWRGGPDTGPAAVWGEGLSIAPKDQFERALYLAVMRDDAMPADALSEGALSKQQRADLSRRLRVLRGLGRHRIAMSIVIFAPEHPGDIDTALVQPYRIPVFSLHHDTAYQLLGGLTAEDLIALLKELLRAVRDDIGTLSSTTAPQRHDAPLDQDRLRQKLADLLAASPEQLKPAEIRALLDEFERSGNPVTPQQRDILSKARDVADKFGSLADSTDKLVPRMIQVLDLLSKYNPF